MRYMLGNIGFAVIVGWLPWTIISIEISYFFNTDPDKTYAVVGLIYATLVFLIVVWLVRK